jgi:hypothetical protein
MLGLPDDSQNGGWARDAERIFAIQAGPVCNPLHGRSNRVNPCSGHRDSPLVKFERAAFSLLFVKALSQTACTIAFIQGNNNRLQIGQSSGTRHQCQENRRHL